MGVHLLDKFAMAKWGVLFLSSLHVCYIPKSVGARVIHNTTPNVMQKSVNDKNCRGACTANQYCYEWNCQECSPCPDPYRRTGVLVVIKECNEAGQCPNICFSNTVLGDKDARANRTFCDNMNRNQDLSSRSSEEPPTTQPEIVSPSSSTEEPRTQRNTTDETKQETPGTGSPSINERNGISTVPEVLIVISCGVIVLAVGAILLWTKKKRSISCIKRPRSPAEDEQPLTVSLLEIVLSENGTSATVNVKDLHVQQPGCNALQVCPCLIGEHRPYCNWIDIPQGVDSMKLEGFSPGGFYRIGAGCAEQNFLLSPDPTSSFSVKAKGTVKTPDVSPMPECSLLTDVLKDFNLKRSLEVELHNKTLLQLLAQFYDLKEDDTKSVVNAGISGLTDLLEILQSTNGEPDRKTIHELITCLKSYTEYPEVNDFIRKLAKRNPSSRCKTCMKLLHESHS